MSEEKREQIKRRLHPRNKNRERYDLAALISSNPELADHVKPNKYGEDSVDFSNSVAVDILNKALLSHYYGVENWDFPDEYLIPTIPGRADYIHHVADLLSENNFGTIPLGDQVTCFDIGVGASCIYPIIGVTEYGWKFIASDIDAKSIESAENIANSNASMKDKIEFRLQKDPDDVFYGIIEREEKVDIAICNPPFHSSTQNTPPAIVKKGRKPSANKGKTHQINLAEVSKELICEGGEVEFLQNMIGEGRKFAQNCFWFSSLVSKQTTLKGMYRLLDKFGATQVKTIPLGTGNKSARIVAWTFLSAEERNAWREARWVTPTSESEESIELTPSADDSEE